MNYKSIWLTATELASIERSADLPIGTLQRDDRADGTKLPGAYINNAINRIPDSDLRDRAEFAMQMYYALNSRHAS